MLHQVLQWHHMVSSTEGAPTTTVAGVELHTLADRLFHLAALAFTAAGMVATLVAWRHGRLAPGGSFHIGLLLVGWEGARQVLIPHRDGGRL